MKRVLWVVILAWWVGAAVSGRAAEVGALARELEGRLIAPCCWRETLDIHQSPIADQLRREIRQRLGAGESVAGVEADLVARYGPQLRATLPGSLGYLLFGLFGIGGLAVLTVLGVRLSRKRRGETDANTEARAPASSAPHDQQHYEDKLDEDLAESSL